MLHEETRQTPVSRLLRFCEQAVSVNGQLRISEALTMLLHVEKSVGEEIVILHQRLAQVYQLPVDAALAMQSLPHFKADLYHAWRPPVDDAFRQFGYLYAPWNEVLTRLPDSVPTSLRWCSQILEVSGAYLEPAADIECLLTKLQDLEHEVVMGALPPELKGLLQRYLREMIAAISQYQIFGAAPARRVAEELIGSVVVDVPQHRDHPAVVSKVLTYLQLVLTSLKPSARSPPTDITRRQQDRS